MIALDTSALVAIVFGEREAEQFVDAIAAADAVVGAATLVEATIVVTARHGEDGRRDLMLLLDRGGVRVHPFDGAQAEIAVEAWNRFGKGRHPAGLNYGDCLAYATALATDRPLLFKGDDFPRTDVRRAGPTA